MVAPTLDSSSGAGNQGTPNPAPSEPQNVQPPSTPAPTQSPEQVRELVTQIVSEALQNPDILKGMKDRRFNQIQRSLDDISPVLERVKEILTPEQQAQLAQIQRDARFEQLEQVVYGKPNTQTGATQSGTPGNAAIDVEAVVKSLQFTDNDPALAALKIKHAGNPQEMVRAAAELRLAQLQTPSPTPAHAPPQSGSANLGLSQDQIDEKALRLEQLYKNPSQNRAEIKVIETELREAGAIKQR